MPDILSNLLRWLKFEDADFNASSGSGIIDGHGSDDSFWNVNTIGSLSSTKVTSPSAYAPVGRIFNTGSDYLNGVYANMDFAPANGTIAFWLNPVQYPSVTGVRQFTCGNTDDGIQFQAFQDGNFYITTDGGSGNRLIFGTDSSNWPLGDWVHHTFTWGSGGKQFYVNGAIAASNAYNAPNSIGSQNFYAGQFGGGSGFNGAMSDYRMYDRELSADDVALLATPASPPTGSPLLLRRRMEAA